MTLDVTIGKLSTRSIEKVMAYKIAEFNDGFYETMIDPAYLMYVEQCPNADIDICDPSMTLWPRESYRSGSSDFWDFFMYVIGIDLYHCMRNHPGTSDGDIALLKPIIGDINIIDDSIIDERYSRIADGMRDRLKWFIYWSNKAVDLYDDYAAIQFT